LNHLQRAAVFDNNMNSFFDDGGNGEWKMTKKASPEYFKLTRLPEFDNLELLQARYSTHVFPRHWNETFIIQIVTQGLNEFYCGRAMHRVPAGSIVLINPHEIHTGYSVGNVPLVYRTIYPPADLLAEMAAQISGCKAGIPFFPAAIVWDGALSKMLVKAHQACEAGREQLASQSLLLIALTVLIRRHADKKISWRPLGKEIDRVKQAKNYIEDNFSRHVSLHDLAKVSHLSPFHFLRAFRKEAGLPPHEYLINVRIARAKALLTQDHPIAQMAYETNFTNQNHLHRQFRRLVGVTPGQYVRSYLS
jgi:AraC-like DNA-binding protein